MTEFVEQRLGFFQIGGIKTLGEPVVHIEQRGRALEGGGPID